MKLGIAILSSLVLILMIPPKQQALQQLGSDGFTNSGAQHATEVEPASFAWGQTMVVAYQVGVIAEPNFGATDIGFSTSTDGGEAWQSGTLPDLTTEVGGTYDAANDPSVAYDAAHGEWLIGSLPVLNSHGLHPAVLVSRSVDGLNWGNPVDVDSNVPSSDKDWLACDDSTVSPFYGTCYVEWTNKAGGADQLNFSASTDGGQTWSAPVTPSGAIGFGAETVIQPGGVAIAPFLYRYGTTESISVVTSANGGRTWTAAATASSVFFHTPAGNLRAGDFPGVAIDGAGTVYVTWSDCRYRSKCSANDLLLITSTNGTTWTAPSRIPIDSVSSGIDHFIPGLGAQANTAGNLALIFYEYPVTSCSSSTCQLDVDFISSSNGGRTWGKLTSVAGPMQLSWLAATGLGQMVGDFVTTSFIGSEAFPVFAVAGANNGTTLNEAIYTEGL